METTRLEGKNTVVFSVDHEMGIPVEDVVDFLNRIIEIDYKFVIKKVYIVLAEESNGAQ